MPASFSFILGSKRSAVIVKMYSALLASLLIIGLCYGKVDSQSSFAETVKSYVNDTLGAAIMQKKMNDVQTSEKAIDSQPLLRKIEEDISHKLSNLAESMTKLRESLEIKTPTKSEIKLRDCCKVAYSWEEGQHKIDNTSYCLMHNEKESAADLETDNLLTAAAHNRRSYPEIGYQRYRGINGAILQYPAYYGDIFCEKSDDFESFASSFFSTAKDLVIVMDGDLLQQHRPEMMDAVEYVFKAVNVADNIAFVVYSSDVVTLSNGPNGAIKCKNKEMVSATHKNVEAILAWLKTTERKSGNANFSKALNAAFDYLENTRSTNRKMILFVSGSQHEDSKDDILQTVSDRKSNFQNSVNILTYGVKNPASNDVLQEIAELNEPDTGKHFSYVKETDHLIKHLSFEHFPSSSENEIQWKWPELNKLSDGEIVVTALQSVFVDDKLKGVISVDILLQVLISEVLNFEVQGDDAYVFVMDKNFNVIYHPFISYSSKREWSDRILNIRELEKSDDLQTLLSKIQENQDSESVSSDRVITVSMKTTWRTLKDKINADYSLYNSKVTCTLTDFKLFTVCLNVIDGAEKTVHVKGVTVPEEFQFHYHRIDFSDNPEGDCSHLKNTSFLGTAVYLAPKAFVNPDRYLTEDEDPSRIEKYAKDIQTQSGNIITDSAIQDIFLTFGLEEHWFESDENENLFKSQIASHVIWKYIGTKNGVLRIWPGVPTF
uniref:VWFA and cache domain-containing protein 1-like n=1 Tax=Styela clava TaxID=7725 RepID=UPI00193A424F|nr:VWFA and cache domain-containing protein 1-like [Styela clava]